MKGAVYRLHNFAKYIKLLILRENFAENGVHNDYFWHNSHRSCGYEKMQTVIAAYSKNIQAPHNTEVLVCIWATTGNRTQILGTTNRCSNR